MEGQPARGWIVVNRGLLVDQAELTYHHLPNLEKLWFVVGYDKIVQIFDKKYYENRDDALQRLFSRASFLVAPRGEDDVTDLEALLDRADNRQFDHGVLPLPLPEQYRGVSSSHVRAEVAQSGTFPDVSDLVAAFVSQIGAYDAPHASDGEVINRYEWREGIVKAVELGRIKKPSSSEFYDLFCRTTADGPEGKSLRDWLVRLISPSVADSAAGSIR